jgi:3-hydroxyisobutyrate dehydrogenase
MVDSFLNTHVRAYAGRDIIPSSSPAGIARIASTIFTMLPSSPQVEEVYLGENGILSALEELSEEKRRETLLIDCTTLDQSVAKEVARRMKAMGAEMIDAPVSGGMSILPLISFFCGEVSAD